MKIVIDVELPADVQEHTLKYLLCDAFGEFYAIRCTEYNGQDYVQRRYPWMSVEEAQMKRAEVRDRCDLAELLRNACARGITIEE